MDFKGIIETLEQAYKTECSQKLAYYDFMEGVQRRIGVLYSFLNGMHDEADYNQMEREDYFEQVVLMTCEELLRIREQMLLVLAPHSNSDS